MAECPRAGLSRRCHDNPEPGRVTGQVVPRIADPSALFNPNLCRNPLLHAVDVADGADHLAAGVERAEAFVEEERVDAGLVADQEAFAAGQCGLS